MKTSCLETKSKTYIRIDGKVYMTNHNWQDFTFVEIDLNNMPDWQAQSVNSQYGWFDLGECENFQDAYKKHIERLKNLNTERKKQNAELTKRIESERFENWLKIANLEIIPATVENIRILLEHLNGQNWGTWRLPKLSIGYSANQYDCEGTIATTISLDSAIEYEGKKVSKFKVGGKRGHLNKYQSL